MNFNAEKKLAIIDVPFKAPEEALFSEDTEKSYIKYGFWRILRCHKNAIRLYKFRYDKFYQFDPDPHSVKELIGRLLFRQEHFSVL